MPGRRLVSTVRRPPEFGATGSWRPATPIVRRAPSIAARARGNCRVSAWYWESAKGVQRTSASTRDPAQPFRDFLRCAGRFRTRGFSGYEYEVVGDDLAVIDVTG